MSFRVGDILYFDEYQFTDNGQSKRHFALVLLPEDATKYRESILCCVITSKSPRRWFLSLPCEIYKCFVCDSFACFNRKDLVSKNGLAQNHQPRGALTKSDLSVGWKILRNSLYTLKDIGSNPFFRGAIIYQWKKALGLI